LVAQLPIAHSADRSTIILSILEAKHQSKAQRRLGALPALIRRGAMMDDHARRTAIDFAATRECRIDLRRSSF
jgi:hypothetical protein